MVEAILLGSLSLLAFTLGMVWRTKTQPGHVHKHQARFGILRELDRDPGVRLHELAKRLGLTRSNARYHLYVLERAGAISSIAPPGRHHYFPPDATPEEIRSLSELRNGRAFEIVAIVLDQPGIVQHEVLERIGMHRKVFRSHIRRLAREDLVREEYRPHTRHYHPTEKLMQFLDRWAGTDDPPTPKSTEEQRRRRPGGPLRD